MKNPIKININVLILLTSFILSLIYSIILPNFYEVTDIQRYYYSFFFRYPLIVNFSLIEITTEPGFLLLSNLVFFYIGNFSVLLFLIYFFYISSTLFIMKYLKFSWIIFGLIFFSLYFLQGTYLLKQTLAVSIINISFIFILRRKFIYFSIFVLIASLFQISAIIILPFYFILNFNKNLATYALLFPISFLFFIFYDFLFPNFVYLFPIFTQFVEFDYAEISSQNNLLTIFKGLPFFLLLFFAIKDYSFLKTKSKFFDFYLFSGFLFSLSWLLTFRFYWFFRFGWYFFLPTLFLADHLIKNTKNSFEKYFFIFGFYIILIILTVRHILLIYI